MKKIIVSILLIFASNNVCAESYSGPMGPETVSEFVEINFEPGSFVQSIAEIKKVNIEILLSDLLFGATEGEYYNTKNYVLVPSQSNDKSGIAYTTLCAQHTVDSKRLKDLRAVTFQGTTKIPAAGVTSEYAGSSTGIGSEFLYLYVDFIDPRSPNETNILSGNIYLDTRAVEPNDQSGRSLSVNFLSNDTYLKEDSFSIEGSLKSFHRFNLSISLDLYSEGWFDLADGSGAVRARIMSEMLNSMDDSNNKGDEYFYEEASFPMAATISKDFSMNSTPIGMPKSEDRDAAIVVCWEPGNYESVTQEAAELISPILILQYKK